MDHKSEFAKAVDEGLTSKPKNLPTRYIYDEEGSRLFIEIMNLPEYYLTKAEHEIFETYKSKIADTIGNEKFNLVELGAGNGEKTTTLLKHFVERSLEFRYVPIDISKAAVKDLTQELSTQIPHLIVEGLVMEYFEGLQWVKENSGRRNLVLFLGSNIGNFTNKQIHKFLEGLKNSLNVGDLVAIGFDLKKDFEIIRQAYFDSAGITRDFNLNLVNRINRELGANFDLSAMKYYGTYNPLKGRNEAYLFSTQDQQIHISATGKDYLLKAYEPINTEYSQKFSIEEIEQLAEDHNFKLIDQMTDKKNYFVDSLWLSEGN